MGLNIANITMEINKTSLEGAYLIKPKVFQDERGFFMETYSEKKIERSWD
jgi:dTDP-4-dehydrorhamnose 3,5-epimerase-like enzyme